MRSYADLLLESMYSLGAHVGHLRVESSAQMNYYLIGSRNYFNIFDVSRSIHAIKKALLFFDLVIRGFGHALFCYSGIDKVSIHMRDFIGNVVTSRRQSFSY
jgi:ribosomal protein S2